MRIDCCQQHEDKRVELGLMVGETFTEVLQLGANG
jgi:hypothetical protein